MKLEELTLMVVVATSAGERKKILDIEQEHVKMGGLLLVRSVVGERVQERGGRVRVHDHFLRPRVPCCEANKVTIHLAKPVLSHWRPSRVTARVCQHVGSVLELLDVDNPVALFLRGE